MSAEDDPVPAYEENGLRFADWTKSLDSDSLGLPLTRHPFGDGLKIPLGLSTESLERRETQAIIFCRFFQAITTKNLDVITLMVTNGLISPCAVSMKGLTPLIAAVNNGNIAVVRCLVGLGADVSQLGTHNGAERTPLQVAAERGFLPIVKFLMEECGADDATIAPDGQLALRLAAANGHREVVDYLPVRRGGGWRRWKKKHAVLMLRVQKARRKILSFCEILFWEIPKFFFYSIPKHVIVIPVKDAVKYAIEHRRRFGGWCKRQILAMPGRAKRGAEAVIRGVKKIPRVVARIVKWLWRQTKKAPGRIKRAAVLVGNWLAETARRFGRAVWYVVTRLFSVLHTLVVAVVNFFRQITLKDVWDGFCTLVRAVFVGLPRAIVSGIAALGKTSYEVLKALLGIFGAAIWWTIWGIWYVIQYVPAQIGAIFLSLAKSVRNGFQEVLVWFDPKRSG